MQSMSGMDDKPRTVGMNGRVADTLDMFARVPMRICGGGTTLAILWWLVIFLYSSILSLFP